MRSAQTQEETHTSGPPPPTGDTEQSLPDHDRRASSFHITGTYSFGRMVDFAYSREGGRGPLPWTLAQVRPQ